eukprot:s1489_g15.t1
MQGPVPEYIVTPACQALLRQTEANLAALNKPRQEPPRYLGEPLASAARDPLVGAFREVAEPAPVVLQRGALGSGLELESQVVQLRSCLETLERSVVSAHGCRDDYEHVDL